MTAFDKGMNVTEVRNSADAFVLFSRESGQAREHSERAIALIDRYWDGPDKQRLMERWHSLQPQLRHVEVSLHALSRHLHRDADQQSQASGDRQAAGSPRSAGHSGAGTNGASAAVGQGRPVTSATTESSIMGGASGAVGSYGQPVAGDAGAHLGKGAHPVPPESIQICGTSGATLGLPLSR